MARVLFDLLSRNIGKITLNDPDNLNAMGEEMAAEFRSMVTNLGSDARKLRAIVLTGAGRAFSAGGNLDMLERKSELTGEDNRLKMLDFYHSFLCLLDLKVPLIAAINGHAVGAGLCLASACDIRIASDKAKLGFTFTRLGLHPGMGATYFLPRVIGRAAATELLLTGRLIDAEKAWSLGLVSNVVAPEAILGEAERIAGEIADCGPEAARQVLETVRGGLAELEAHLEREALAQSINYASSEFKEGVRAAIEKRPARF
ncbi:MAG: hypothetical protein RL417_144 [Pseudomonadota bacterium]|jgi:enoyl-CoA hydratase